MKIPISVRIVRGNTETILKKINLIAVRHDVSHSDIDYYFRDNSRLTVITNPELAEFLGFTYSAR